MKKHSKGICEWHPLRMNKKCAYSEQSKCYFGGCQSVDKKCIGCKKIIGEDPEMLVCKHYWNPPAIWRLGTCPMATHIEYIIDDQGRKLDPIKASKLKMGKKTGKKEKRKHVRN